MHGVLVSSSRLLQALHARLSIQCLQHCIHLTCFTPLVSCEHAFCQEGSAKGGQWKPLHV